MPDLPAQSTPDRKLPLRFLQYQVNLIDDYMKDKPADTKWPIIIPICLYHNPEGKCYPYETNVYQCFTDPALAEAIGIFTRIHLKDYNQTPDTELNKHKNIRLMEKLLKYSRHANAFNILTKELEAEDNVNMLRKSQYWQQVFSYTTHVVAAKDASGESKQRLINLFGESKQKLINLFKEKLKLTQSDTAHMETIAEVIQREGREAGIALGMERGMEKRTFDIAKNMLVDNF